jgi:hypothetical protein
VRSWQLNATGVPRQNHSIFAMKDHNNWRNSFYIPGDSHFNERGPWIRLIREFEGYLGEPQSVSIRHMLVEVDEVDRLRLSVPTMANQTHESYLRQEAAVPSSDRSFGIVMAAAFALLTLINF